MDPSIPTAGMLRLARAVGGRGRHVVKGHAGDRGLFAYCGRSHLNADTIEHVAVADYLAEPPAFGCKRCRRIVVSRYG